MVMQNGLKNTQFLTNCPTLATDYGTGKPGALPALPTRLTGNPTFNNGGTTVTVNGSWPMWGLGVN